MRTFTEEEVEILLNSRICEKPKTRADRFRSMSDEELAEFFENEITIPDDGLYLIIDGKKIWNKNDMLAWLQSEVEE